MRKASKGMVVEVLTGEHTGRKAEVVRGSSLDGSGVARLKLVRGKGKGGPRQLELFTQNLRSMRLVKGGARKPAKRKQ